MGIIQQIIIAFIISAIVVSIAYWRQSLSGSGAAAALAVGTLTFGLGGWQWGVLLGLFFVSSSLLSHYKEGEKRGASEKFEKGHRRDAGQVIANGGLGAGIALFHIFVPGRVTPSSVWFIMFLGVMATVTADTWATELGTLSKRPPRLITNGRIVEVGVSGGITPLGIFVSFLGGLMIGLAAGLMVPEKFLIMVSAGALAGLIGSLFDSLLGATIQRTYFSEPRQKETEKRFEEDGTANKAIRGLAWMSNDLVNLFSSIVGGAAALFFSTLLA